MRATAAAPIAVAVLAVLGAFGFMPSKARAQTCPANSEPYQTEDTATGTVTHCQCISGYALSNGSCQPQQPAAPAPKPHPQIDVFQAYCTSKSRVEADRSAIAGLGFASNASSFEDYAAKATNYRNDFVLQAAGTLFNAIAVDKAVEYGKSLNPWSVNTRIKELRAAANGGSTEEIEKALRFLASVRNKPAMAPYASNAIGEAANKLFEKLKDAKLNVETKKRDDPATPGYVGALILAGKLATTNPWANLAISGTEMARTAAMAYGINQNVDRLSALNEQQMRQLEIYRHRLEKDVAAARAAKRAWQRATGQTQELSCSVG